MRFKLNPDVENQLQDMPIIFLVDEEIPELFYSDKICRIAVKAFKSKKWKLIVNTFLNHSNIVFAHGTTIIDSKYSRQRLRFDFPSDYITSSQVENVINESLGELYRDRLIVMRNIWVGTKSVHASFTIIPELYRQKIRAFFIDSFISEL